MPQAFASTIPSYQAQPSEASVADVGRAVLRHWRWVVIPTLAAFVLALLFVTLVSPRYTGESKLLLQASDTYFTRPAGSERVEQQPLIDEQAVASQVQVVMSRDLAREAIRQLGLVGNAEFDPEVSGLNLFQRLAVMLGVAKDPLAHAPEERVLDKFYDNLLVYPVGKSRIVAIEFRSKDADLAARGANTIADLYLGRQDDAKKDQARSASTWLGSNVDALRSRVAEAEAKVEAFRSNTGLLVGAGTTTISAQQLSELSTQLAQARSQRSDSQAKAKLIREAIREGRAFEIPDVANNELIRRLLEQRINLRTQLALEQRTLLPQHPRIKELNAQVQDLESQIRLAAERTVRTLENDARIAGTRVESIETAIEQQKKIVSEANENEVKLRALEREARAQREQLESYLGRFREASARDTDYGAPPDARVVSRAVTPQIPSFPKKLPIVGLATFAMLMLTVGSIMARELLATRPAGAVSLLPYESEPAQTVYPFPARGSREFDFDLGHLGRGPILDGRARAAHAEPTEPDPRYDFGQLVERVSRHDPEGRGRRLLVAGLSGREDALLVSRGLAITLSRGQRVILLDIDTDEETPVDAVPGLTDLVAGEASFSEVIQRDSGSSLHRVATGTLLNEALTSSPEGLDVALQAFESTYDWVICAVLGNSDEALLRLFASRADTVVLASNLEPANPDLVHSYETAKAAGAAQVIVAREHATVLDEAA
ncbi:GumC family protein [uncultured Enterovirga sp.]|uniref:GumC family protein n=1 Tax=uncultured Enterovirga sp. TaxID=2026352 RepID=UPI0035C9A366